MMPPLRSFPHLALRAPSPRPSPCSSAATSSPEFPKIPHSQRSSIAARVFLPFVAPCLRRFVAHPRPLFSPSPLRLASSRNSCRTWSGRLRDVVGTGLGRGLDVVGTWLGRGWDGVGTGFGRGFHGRAESQATARKQFNVFRVSLRCFFLEGRVHHAAQSRNDRPSVRLSDGSRTGAACGGKPGRLTPGCAGGSPAARRPRGSPAPASVRGCRCHCGRSQANCRRRR